MSRLSFQQRTLAKRILLTLGYSSQFGFPLTVTELYSRLVALPDEEKSGAKTSAEDMTQMLEWLHVHNLVTLLFDEKTNSIWVRLKKDSGVVSRRQRSEFLSYQRLASENLLVQFVSWIPWIEAIGITGSQAVGNADPDADIDVLVITKAHRLWISRALVAVASLVTRAGRLRHSDERQSWCFNLWLEENALEQPLGRQNIYTAFEVWQVRWISLRDHEKVDFRPKWLQANTWIAEYLPNVRDVAELDDDAYEKKSRGWLQLELVVLNWLFFVAQTAYMAGHRTREYIAYNQAYFHPRATGSMVWQGWKRALKT